MVRCLSTEKAVINLLSNAYKFTPKHGVVALSINQTTDDVTIVVSDNGRGISDAHLTRLFENYYQVADHGFQNTGYGIGLALSKAIVELHQGSITVISREESMNTPGHTAFTISLPKRQIEKYDVAPANPLDNALTKQPVKQQPIEQSQAPILMEEGHKLTVLLVEDNLELAALLADILNWLICCHRAH